MALLYRGISQEDDERNQGMLRPKGIENAVSIRRDGKVHERKGHFVRVPSESNAVRAHQIGSGLYNGCWLSFTKCEKVARRFATNHGTTDGFVYVVDEDRLAEYGVVTKEFSDSETSGEVEVTLRAADNGDLPPSIVIEKRQVCANDV